MKYDQTIVTPIGLAVHIRNGVASDGSTVLENFNLTHAETDYLLSYPDENHFDAEQESQYLEKKSTSPNEIELIAFVDGMVTDQADLTDEMYEKGELHNENGAWQMIFGVNTIPSCRKKGYAGELIKAAIEDARKQGRKGLVLTCKDKLIHYYAKFGFVNEGVSQSVHGNVVWYQMRLTF